jgi:hypothetical protein
VPHCRSSLITVNGASDLDGQKALIPPAGSTHAARVAFGGRGIPGDVYTRAPLRCAAKFFASDVTVCRFVSNYPGSGANNRGRDVVRSGAATTSLRLPAARRAAERSLGRPGGIHFWQKGKVGSSRAHPARCRTAAGGGRNYYRLDTGCRDCVLHGGNAADGSAGAQPIPAVYGFCDFSPDLKLGLALSAPFGLKTQYESDWVGRYQAIKSDIETININPNVAYRISDWLSVGGGPVIQHLHTELSNAINSITVARSANPLLPPTFTLPDGSARVSGNSASVGYNVGVLAEISPDTRFGASYRSQVSHRIDGIAAFNVPAPLAASPAFKNTPARADLKTPEIVNLAAPHNVSPEVTILAEAQWTNSSVVKNLRIERPDGSTLTDQPEQWHGTWFGSVGAIYRPVSNWVLRGGVAYDATPTRNQFLTARLPDADRYWLALGFGYE